MPEPLPTWDTIGSLSHAVFMLTQANLTHDQCVRLAGPIISEIAVGITVRVGLQDHAHRLDLTSDEWGLVLAAGHAVAAEGGWGWVPGMMLIDALGNAQRLKETDDIKAVIVMTAGLHGFAIPVMNDAYTAKLIAKQRSARGFVRPGTEDE